MNGKQPLKLDDLRAIKRDMVRIGKEMQQEMPSQAVVGVLISMYAEVELEIERRALSYALVMLLERSVRSDS